MTFWLEVIGWLGSAVLVWSLAQARVVRFRALNLAASVVLTGYNAALGVWPMVAMNAVIAGLDVYHLVRLLRGRDDAAVYEVVEVRPDDAYLRHVLDQHAPDIERHNPGFAWGSDGQGSDADGGSGGAGEPHRAAFLVLRDIETVGVVLLADDGSGDGRVELDYVLPRFRDFSVGKFVYRRGGDLTSRGFRRLVASTRMPDASDYFPRVGFTPDPSGRLVLELVA
jgi:hypothetical protein